MHLSTNQNVKKEKKKEAKVACYVDFPSLYDSQDTTDSLQLKIS